MIFQGIRTRIAEKPYIFVIFFFWGGGGGGGGGGEASGSADVLSANLLASVQFLLLLPLY